MEFLNLEASASGSDGSTEKEDGDPQDLDPFIDDSEIDPYGICSLPFQPLSAEIPSTWHFTDVPYPQEAPRR